MLSVLTQTGHMQCVKMFVFGGFKKIKKSQVPTFQKPRFSWERRFTSLVLLLQCRRLGWTPGKATRRIWQKCRAAKFIVRIWASAFLPVKRDFVVTKTLSQKPTSTPPYFSSLLVCCDELTGRKVLIRDSDRTGSGTIGSVYPSPGNRRVDVRLLSGSDNIADFLSATQHSSEMRTGKESLDLALEGDLFGHEIKVAPQFV